MKKNFLDMKTSPGIPTTLGFADGFKFGFGMFVAWLLGISVLSGVGFGLLKLLHLI